MNSILLSIHPEYVENILAGTKRYEYRKRLANKDIKYIYIYSTSPVMKVVAKVHVAGTIQASPTKLWECTKKDSGISRERYRQYFRGCSVAFAYRLGKVIIFDRPKDLQDFGIAVAPQSFVYLQDGSVQNFGSTVFFD